MGQKLAIDFGTTNSVIARWETESETAEIIALPGLSDPSSQELPAVVPSLLYVTNGTTHEVVCGQHVRDQGLDTQRDNRLFRNFKRGIV
ncbi:MAG: Hsp70 family protein, partial [Anaerolineae bacterium]|nr:Hsp70 family protein [Anaerolineae bacterium]